MIPNLCEHCGVKPQGYRRRRWCYDCKPGSKGRPRPCRRCGSTEDYWTERLCRRCHQYAPQRPEPCRDCLAWGARRTQKWLCEACIGWRARYPGTAKCVSCGQRRAVNPEGCCRLCWRQTKLVQEHLRGRRRGPLNILEANRFGQQLFLANMGSSKNGYQPRSRPDPPAPAGIVPRNRRRQHIQLDLFSPDDRITKALHRHGVVISRDARLAARLDAAAREHAARHGWRSQKTHDVRTGIRVLLDRRPTCGLPINVSEAAFLPGLELPVRPILAVLDDAGVLHDDRPASVETWFERKVCDLPDTMADELRQWFDVLHNGSSTPPRSRPRHPVTIKTRLAWSLPTLQLWATAGHDSLREISREDILTVLPSAGTPRVKLGDGLRSIFGTLRARKVLFINPMARIRVGNFERRTPLPTDTARLRAALEMTDPTGTALAALSIFHGLRPLEVPSLKLTDVRDTRLYLPNRTVPLAKTVQTRLAAYLDHRHARWPNSINSHFFIHHISADTTGPVSVKWISTRIGMSAQAIRQDRIVNEAIATAGDLRRICDFFGVTMTTSEHYATSLNHTAFNRLGDDRTDPGSETQAET